MQKVHWSITADVFCVHAGNKYSEVVLPWGHNVTFSAKGGEIPIKWAVTKNDTGDGNIPALPNGRDLIFGAIGADGTNPVNPGTYTVIATDNGNLTDSMTLVVVDLKIKRNGLDVTMPKTGSPSPIDVYIGQENDFIIEVTPSGMASTYNWNIPGTKIKNWTPADSGPTLTTLPDTDLANQNISFYWIDGLSDFNINVTVTIDGENNISVSSVPFNVKKPANPMNPIMQSTEQVIVGGILGMYLFKSSPVTQGIVFNAESYPNKTEIPGSFKYVQIIQSSSRIHTKNDDSVEITSVSNKLDVAYPYPVGVDSPGQDYPNINLYKKLEVDDNYKTYLMYNPGGTGSIDVPISFFTWNWKAYSERDGSPYHWKTPVDSSTKSSNTITTVYPTWDGKR